MDIKVFRRVEKKYLLTKKQYNSLMKELKKYIEVDTYDYSTICNIYFFISKILYLFLSHFNVYQVGY